MEVVVTPQASRWAVFWTLVALATAIFAGHNIDQYVSGEAKLLASAVIALATVTSVMVYTIKGYHKADVDQGKLAVLEMQSMADDMDLLKQATKIAKELMQEAQAQAKEVGEHSESVAKEVQVLRASERTLQDKLAGAKQAIADANQATTDAENETATANIKLAGANRVNADAIAKAVKEAKVQTLPYVEAGEYYLLNSTCNSILTHNSTFSDEDRVKANECKKELKPLIKAFVKEYGAIAEKTILG